MRVVEFEKKTTYLFQFFPLILTTMYHWRAKQTHSSNLIGHVALQLYIYRIEKRIIAKKKKIEKRITFQAVAR